MRLWSVINVLDNGCKHTHTHIPKGGGVRVKTPVEHSGQKGSSGRTCSRMHFENELTPNSFADPLLNAIWVREELTTRRQIDGNETVVGGIG